MAVRGEGKHKHQQRRHHMKKKKKQRHTDKDGNPTGNYPGCYRIESKDRYGRPDWIYYCRIKQDGKAIDCKHGRKSEGKSFTTTKNYRIKLIAGTEVPNQQKRAKKQAATRNHLAKTWERYGNERGGGKKVDGKHVRHNQQADYGCATSRYTLYILPVIGADTDLTTLTAKDFERVEAGMDHLGYSSQYHVLADLKKYCRMAGWVEDPNNKVSMPSAGSQKTDEDLTPEELARLQEVLRTHPNRIMADLLSFIMHTGCRAGECLRLRREHLDFNRHTVRLVDRKATKTNTRYINTHEQGSRGYPASPYQREYGSARQQRLHLPRQVRW